MKKSIYLITFILVLACAAAGQSPAKRSVQRAGAAPETVVNVTAPTLNIEAGADFTIPVTVSDTTGLNVIAYQFDLHYDPTVIQPQANAVEVAGTLSGGLAAVYNPNIPGNLKVAVYGAYPLAGAGTLINFKFKAVGAAGSSSPLTWVNLMFNEGNPGVSGANGQIKIVPNPSSLQTTFSGRESAVGAMDYLNHMHRGNTFVLVSDDHVNATSLTVSFDLIQTDEPGYYKIANGQWTLMVYDNGVYAGSIYGEVTSGKVRDQIDGATGDAVLRTIKARLRVQGGIGRYESTPPEAESRGDFISSTSYVNGKTTTAVLKYIL